MDPTGKTVNFRKAFNLGCCVWRGDFFEVVTLGHAICIGHSVLFLAIPLWLCVNFAPAQPATRSAVEDSKQVSELVAAVRGRRVGFLTNPTGVDSRLNMLADIVQAERGTSVTAFFAPEHGIRGDIQSGRVTDYIDPYTSVPVYSLFGGRRAPTPEQLDKIDVLVFAIQDVGARFYTYVWTMTYAMQACASQNKQFIVYDFPNPIGADVVQGSPSRITTAPLGVLATRHGMTAGEIASMFNGEFADPKAELQVIRVPGYTRHTTFAQTSRTWVPPSPNMPNLETAFVYPGTCVFEGTNVSEGRGTANPFEFVGAPFINGIDLARKANALHLPGVQFRPVYFAPTHQKYENEYCGGVQVHVLDRRAFDPIRAALHLLKLIYTMYPDQVQIRPRASSLMGVPNLHEQIRTEDVDHIIDNWQEDLERFKTLRKRYLIYPEG